MLTSPGPLRIAVLCSRRAPGLRHLIESGARPGADVQICCVIASEPACGDADLAAVAGVPVVRHPIADFCAARGSSVFRDVLTRRAYDCQTVERIVPFNPDIVLLDGYLYLVTRPMLEAFRNRILNLHFSDLTIRRADGGPAYAGIRAVRDALRDGQHETCATVHLVSEEPDGGPPIVRSAPYPVSPMVARALEWGATDMLKAYAFAHQEWMIRDASGPLLSAALHLVSSGAADLDALAASDPASTLPWLIDARGRLMPPAAVRVYQRLWGYQRAG